MQDNDPTIVVGVDGSDASLAALIFAFQEAVRRQATAKVVTAWEPPENYGLMSPSPGFDMCREDAQAIQNSQVSLALTAVADPPPFSRHIVLASPGQALVEAAEGAELLVVGTSHTNTVGRRLLGSVSETCLRRAGCPVTIVKAPHHGRRHHVANAGTPEVRAG